MDSTIFKLAWTFSEISMSEGFSSDSLHTNGLPNSEWIQQENY